MEKSERVQKYLQALKEMLDVREKNGGADSPEEEAMNDDLDVLWYQMTEEEVQCVNTVLLAD
jgi:hypothetical protein